LIKQLDLDGIAKRLTPWLAAKMPAARDLRMTNMVRPSLGVSNDTAVFDIEWNEAGASHRQRLVARMMPTERLIFPDYDLARQYRAMAALANTEIPVPRMRWFEPDTNVLGQVFFIMDASEGEAPSDVPPYHAPMGMVFEATPEQRAKLWWNGIETMARIHALDWTKLDVGFLGKPANPAAAMDAQLDYWDDYFQWARTDEPQPVLDAGIRYLRDERPTPARTALCWGDSRLGNMLFVDFECTAVLDWEMAFLGDPEADLAWFMFLDWNHSDGYGLQRLEGFPTRAETIARYEKITGAAVRNFDYYEAFAAFRFGAIMARVATTMREAGLPMPTEDFASNNPCTRRLAELLGMPPPGAR
jgi:aminoglycoside phosphotransferase (APT) family kinase protein